MGKEVGRGEKEVKKQSKTATASHVPNNICEEGEVAVDVCGSKLCKQHLY